MILTRAQEEYVSEKPLGVRVFIGGFALLFAFGAVYGVVTLLTGKHSDQDLLLAWILAIQGSLTALLFFWWTGPSLLRINFHQRSYEYQAGFPGLAKRHSGSFRDMNGLYIKRSYNRNGPDVYSVMLKWRVARRGETILGNFKDKTEAYEQMEIWAERLDIPAKREGVKSS